MWYRFQVTRRSQFSRINVSIKWKYNFNILFKNVCIKSLSSSLLANILVVFTDQWISESQVFFCLNHNRVDLIFKLVYIEVSCRKIYGSPSSVNTLQKQDFHTSYDSALLSTSLFR